MKEDIIVEIFLSQLKEIEIKIEILVLQLTSLDLDEEMARRLLYKLTKIQAVFKDPI